jgi:hypothetical protein
MVTTIGSAGEIIVYTSGFAGGNGYLHKSLDQPVLVT